MLQVTDERAFAVISSSSVVMFGRVESRAGSKNGYPAMLFFVFGTGDPHVPEPARKEVNDALRNARVTTRLFDAEHAFMRDEGPRYDSLCTDLAFADMIQLFRNTFGESSGTAA